MASPFDVKRLPSQSESARPSACERSRISVEPSVPAASTTISAVTKYLCPRCVSASVGIAHTRQPCCSSRDSDSTRMPVNTSAPNAAASAM